MKPSNYTIPLRLGASVISPGISDRMRQDLSSQRFTKAEVLYISTSVVPPAVWIYTCRTCYFYQDSGKCQIVEGDINPRGWCVVWINKEEDKPFSWLSLQAMQERAIYQDLSFRQAQADYFKTREKKGAVLALNVYMPVIEPERGSLIAVFYEPGAAHLVFRDEIAPVPEMDERYRVIREEIYGRHTDVESVEFLPGDRMKFYNNASLLQPYKSSFHYSSIEPYKSNVYVNTWNHMLSSRPSPAILIEGGYRYHEVETRRGTREDADRWEVGS